MSLAHVNRTDPSGIKMKNGYRMLVTLGNVASAPFWEVSVKPPGVDGGDEIDTTTMHNDEWRSKAPRALKDLTNSSTKAAYDPKIWNTILSQVNVPQVITFLWPNGDLLSFYGFLKKWEPSDLTEGEMPTNDFEIVATNEDPATGAEVAPLFNELHSGT